MSVKTVEILKNLVEDLRRMAEESRFDVRLSSSKSVLIRGFGRAQGLDQAANLIDRKIKEVQK